MRRHETTRGRLSCVCSARVIVNTMSPLGVVMLASSAGRFLGYIPAREKEAQEPSWCTRALACAWEEKHNKAQEEREQQQQAREQEQEQEKKRKKGG